MSAEQVALIPRCAECEAHWLPTNEESGGVPISAAMTLDEPAEVSFYCPACAEREFGGD